MTQVHSTAIAIIIGSLLVAGSIVYTNQNHSKGASDGALGTVAEAAEPKRTENRALYGSAEAATTIVEFSDYQCPYCARVHPTIKRIVDESNGEINWEYRHLPLPFHTSAEYAALVAECVYKHKGNEAFWSYGDALFADQRNINPTSLLEHGIKAGLTAEQITACESDPEIAAQINNDMATAQALGGRGTPFSVIVSADGSTTPVSGALPYAQWQQLLTN